MKFLEAANYTHYPSREITLLVIHDMEAPEKGTTAEACAAFFHNQPHSDNGTSAHYCIDNDSVVQSVRDHDEAWAAPGANYDGLHFEHAGYASQSVRDWADAFSTEMLKRSAHLVARKAKRYHVPLVHLTPVQIKAGHAGVCGHLDITQSGIAPGTHTDPGPNFPWERYMRYVHAYAHGVEPANFIHGEH